MSKSGLMHLSLCNLWRNGPTKWYAKINCSSVRTAGISLSLTISGICWIWAMPLWCHTECARAKRWTKWVELVVGPWKTTWVSSKFKIWNIEWGRFQLDKGGLTTAFTKRWVKPSEYTSGRLESKRPIAFIQSGKLSAPIRWCASKTTSRSRPPTYNYVYKILIRIIGSICSILF